MENFKDRTQFKFYISYYKIALEIEDLKERSDYLMAICEYQFTGILPELTGMTKFAFLSQKHSLDKQVNGYNDAIEALKKPATHTPTPTGGSVPIPSTHTPITINNNKEIIINKENKILNIEENNTATPFSFFNELILLGVEKELINEWLKVRKTKKLTNTKTAFKDFISEVEKSKKPINEVLKKCVKQSWGGFEASWKWEDNNNINNNQNGTAIQYNRNR